MNPEDLKLIQEFESGIKIVESRHVEPGVVYMASKSETLGTIPIRTEMTVLPADEPSNKVTGWKMMETVGMAVANPKGVTRMTFNPLDLPEVLFWPVPGHPGNNLKIVYHEDHDRLCFFLISVNRNAKHLLNYGENGFSRVYGSDLQFSEIPGNSTAQKLCFKVCSAITDSKGPAASALWQALIDDLPNVLLATRVMLS